MNRIQTEANQTNNNLVNMMAQLQQWTVNNQKETKDKEEREKQEAEVKAEREKQEVEVKTEQQKEKDEQNEREKRAAAAREEQCLNMLIQVSDNMAMINQNRVPQSIVNTNASALSLSKITTESYQWNAITPYTKTRATKRNIETQDSEVTEETEVVPKYRKIYGDSSGATASTTGVESHSENHDLHNGDESAQNHDHQAGFEQRKY